MHLITRECRVCGCTEHNACVTQDGPCHWVLLDVFQPTGICSACAEELGWHQGLLTQLGFEFEGAHA